MVQLSRGDGFAISLLKRAGIRQLILSAENNPVVAAWARKLGIELIQGCEDKAGNLTAYCQAAGIGPARVAYVGNDLGDLDAMKSVAWPVAPADHPEVKESARIVTGARGGDGVI